MQFNRAAMIFLIPLLGLPSHAQEAEGDAVPLTRILPPAEARSVPVQPAEDPVYDEQADGAEQIKAALARATRENRRVLIQWGANWCGWCIKLHGQCETNAELRRKLLYEYDVVHIDVGRFDKHMDLANSLGADLSGNGIPFWTVLGADGDVLANQETGSLENESGAAESHNTERVLAFLTEHQATYQSATAILDDALAEANSQGKTAFVHFGAPWCGWCHRLEDFLAREDIAELFEPRFVDVKIDIDRTIGGGEMLSEMRESPRGGIPWFAFLEGNGEITVHSSSEGQNIGYPAMPEEAAVFIRMLRKVEPPFTDEELSFIERELVDSLKPRDE